VTVVAGVLAAGLVAWLAAPLATGTGLGFVFDDGIALGFMLGFAFGVVVWVLAIPTLAVLWVRDKMGRQVEFADKHAGRLSGAEAPARGVGIGDYGTALFFGLAAGGAAGLLAWRLAGLAAGPATGLAAGPATGLAVGLLAGLRSMAGDLTGATSPGVVLARDRRVALLLILGGGLAVGIAFVFMTGFLAVAAAGTGPRADLGTGLAYALAGGITVGLGLGITQTAWPSYMLTRLWLALRHQLPWRLMAFLADAHRRGVLRQAGAVYQFRHIELQRRLANRDADPQ